jgi:hypothetical protein
MYQRKQENSFNSTSMLPFLPLLQSLFDRRYYLLKLVHDEGKGEK